MQNMFSQTSYPNPCSCVSFLPERESNPKLNDTFSVKYIQAELPYLYSINEVFFPKLQKYKLFVFNCQSYIRELTKNCYISGKIGEECPLSVCITITLSPKKRLSTFSMTSTSY